MIDCHNKRIYVGWAEHEILWLQAAMVLPLSERSAAYQDIADMTGRTYAGITWQVSRQRGLEREHNRLVRLTAERPQRITLPPVPLPPSSMNTSPQMLAKRLGAR